MAILTNFTTAIGGVLNGDYKELVNITPTLQNVINGFDGLVLIREKLMTSRTTGTLWYKGQVLGFTVEDLVRKSKIADKTSIPDTVRDPSNVETLTANPYYLTLGTTGNENLTRNYVKFPNDTRSSFRSPGVFPRVGTDATANSLKSDGFSFGGIRIHNGSDENWSSGCIIFSRIRNANGTLKNDLEGSHFLTKWIYNHLGFAQGKSSSRIIIINEFEFPQDLPKTQTTGVIIDQTTNQPIQGTQIQIVNPTPPPGTQIQIVNPTPTPTNSIQVEGFDESSLTASEDEE